VGKGVPCPHACVKFTIVPLENGLSPPKSSKYEFLVISLSLRGQSPKEIFTKFGFGERDSEVRTFRPNFTVVASKIRLTAAKIAKIGIFCIHLAQRGMSP